METEGSDENINPRAEKQEQRKSALAFELANDEREGENDFPYDDEGRNDDEKEEEEHGERQDFKFDF
jgi:hypothetical protein